MRLVLCLVLFSSVVVHAKIIATPSAAILPSSNNNRKRKIPASTSITAANPPAILTRSNNRITKKRNHGAYDIVEMIPYGGGSSNREIDDNNNSKNHREAAWVSGLKNFIASGMAAACSKLILAPFDTIKTIQQHSRTSASAATALSFRQAAKVIMSRPNGFLEFYVRKIYCISVLSIRFSHCLPHHLIPSLFGLTSKLFRSTF